MPTNGTPAGTAPLRKFSESAAARVLGEVSQSAELRRHLIADLERHYSAKVVLYFTSFGRSNHQIDDSDAEMLESVLNSEHDGGKLLLVVNSPGGQALAAERIVNICRSYSNNQFEVLVPHMAKSAATMVCFGASVIHMSPTAELGPVDPQVPYWASDEPDLVNDPPQWISAEEYLRSYDKLIESASSGRAKRIEPYIQQLNRYDARYIERLRSLQKLSGEVSVRLLRSLMMKGKSEKAIRKSIDVFLTQARTSSHGRMINQQEAANCGLKVRVVDLKSAIWQSIWELYVRSNFAVMQCGKLIETGNSALSVGGM